MRWLWMTFCSISVSEILSAWRYLVLQMCKINESSRWWLVNPEAFFLEHFTMEPQRERENNLLKTLLYCKLRLFKSIPKPASGFALIKDPVGDDNNGNVKVNLKTTSLARETSISVIRRCSVSTVPLLALWSSCGNISWMKRRWCFHTATCLMRSTICA